MRGDGGAAFPQMMEEHAFDEAMGRYDRRLVPHGGMSLRQWYAGQALQGLLASHHAGGAGRIFDCDAYAKDAFAFADAMLKAGA